MTSQSTGPCWVPAVAPWRFAIAPAPRGDSALDTELRQWKAMGVGHVVSLLDPNEDLTLGLADEARWCERHAISFARYPIGDRRVPNSIHEAVRQVDQIAERLRSGIGVVVHCRLGIGRSGLIGACVLYRAGVPAPEVFPALRAARGIDVPDTREQFDWFFRFAAADV